MSKYNVLGLVGSLRKDSFNLQLAKAIALLGRDKFNLEIAEISDLPLFNQDLEASFPDEAQRLKKEIENADAILFVTPEYNRGYPAPLKNAIDWASRPYGKNSFSKKPAALCGTSPGAIGTACSQHALRSTLLYLGLVLMGSPEMYFQYKENIFDSTSHITNEDSRKFIQSYVDAFYNWIEKHKS